MLKQFVDRFVISPLIGVDVGSAAVKVVEVAWLNGRLILRHCAVAPVNRDDHLVGVLKRLVAEAGVTTTQAALGLASPDLIVKPFQFPPMPKKELAHAIRLEAEQAILNGHTPDEMAVDWHILSANPKETTRGLLAVVPKTVLRTRLRTVKAAGLRPTVVDVEGLALWNAYWALVGRQESAPKTVLLINLGTQTTNVVIAKGPDHMILVRDLQLGAQALTAGQEKDWIAEVRDSLGYARSKGGLRALDHVYVTGGGSGPNVIPLLQAIVTAPLTFWNPLHQLMYETHGPLVEDSAGPLLAIAIGLALRQPL